ncbi:epiplakin [Sceloporus undulatus]|uniref:epiplakin n=1 Tax=Sceloporus undulatus TaxID=8520 RepID=UPI001C4CF729|nr:epiplakin [Sceloporus undulatus]
MVGANQIHITDIAFSLLSLQKDTSCPRTEQAHLPAHETNACTLRSSTRQVAAKGQVRLTPMPGGCSSFTSDTEATVGEMCSRSISGVYLEASGKTVSLVDAVQEHLLQPDVALALLEAQAATGGIVDPVRNQLVPVAEALALGLVGLELKEKILCAERAVTGFTDPYTEEKISLYQAIQKELVGREQGLRLLEAQIATGGIIDPITRHRVSPHEASAHGYLDEDLHNSLSDPENEEAKGYLDPNSNQKVTYTELMRRCIADPATGLLLLPLKISFPGLRGSVCSHELLDSGIIDSATFKALHNGELTAQEVAEMDVVQQYLSGTNSIAGVAVLQTNECKSLYQALSEHLLLPGTAVILLQAQAATGGLIDPVKNERFSLDEAVRSGVVGPELYEKLLSAERAVTGYRDPYTGETLSLFQALQKGLVPRDPGVFLLEAQLATGGIVDPHTHHRLPVEMACQRGHLDKDTHSLLCQPMDDLRGFFELNSKENLSYAELLLRCVTDPDTGLCLFPLYGDPGREHHFIDHRTQLVLRNRAVPVAYGKFKGQSTSLWKLLFSDCFTREQRRALLQQFRSGGLSIHRLADTVRDTVWQVSANPRITFEGLRSKVTPAQLLSSEIINKDLFEKLTHGETLAKDVVNMGTVKKYLEGTGSISGLFLPDSQEKIGIYQAKRKGLLRPGTSLILLEAQAATGYIIDPAANKKYSVNEALRANVIGPDVFDKLLAAEKAVTGYRDPYTGCKLSLFQAMTKDLIVKEHAIRLLEAQIATGGIIDPINSHRLPVEAAYKRGYFDKKMNLILSDPSDDTKGFFDPNTHENLTYLQLKEKCITEPTTGLCLLPLNSKKRQFIDDATKQAFRSSWLFVKYGRFQGQRVSVWDLLNSEYFSEGKRREIFNHYHLQKVTLQQICLLLEEEMKKWARIRFPAIRGYVTAYHLVETGIIDRTLFERLLEGAVSPEEVLHMESVRKYLYGTGSIGGIVLQPSNERVSLYAAMQRNIVLPGVALPLLEAQAATGFIVDPVSNQKLCLDDAVKEGLVGPELYEKLQRAEEAVTGYRDPFTGKRISLFQAMKKGLVPDKRALQLMDAQLSTGGVIDPQSGHYVPVEFAQKKGYLDEDLHKALSNPSSDTKAFSTLDRRETVSYSQLIDRCQKDDASGIHLLPLSQAAASPVCTDEQIEELFRATLVEDRGVTLWELLHSGYFTEEQRRDLFEKYRSEALSLQQLITLIQEHIQEIEIKAQTQVTFRGLKGAVPAVWLLDTGIISEQTFTELAQGKRTAREVSEMESVKKYLKGTGAIAGVFDQSSGEKMGIYQAIQNGLLLPGMGARLLEAQAATGSISDPVTSQRLDVGEAIRAGLVGKELMEQLLQAERALTGYLDPYSGKPISVCQAVRKELIPATAGIPLLEAQLATGGIIDPSHHLHLPLPAAYKHGFYDEEMHKTLSQQSDDTRVFFDPNTQESLTYQQLKDRCIQDAGTGLLLLPLSDDAAFYGDRQTIEVLKSVTVCVNIGRYKGQEVSLWDLLNSEYIASCKRRELMLTYKEENAEALQEIITVITKIIEETEQQGKRFSFKGLRKQVSASDLFQSQLIDKETLDDLSQGKKTVQEVTEMDSVRRYLEGGNFIAGVLLQPSNERMSIYQAMKQGLLRPGAALVLLEAQAATGFLIDPVKNKKLSVDEAMAARLIGREVYEKLLSAEKAVTGYRDPYTKEQISLFEAMNQELIVKSHGIRLLEAQIATGGIIDPVHSHRIPVEVAYRRGYFDEKLNQILLDPTDDTKGFFDPNTHENLTYLQLLERCVQDPETGLYMLQVVRKGGRYFYIDEATKQFLQSQPMQMQVGRYKGQAVSLWDLLCSPYIPEQRRKELVRQYKYKSLTLEQFGKTITAIVEETEEKAQKLCLKGLRGDVSAAELFNAEIIDKKTLDGLHHHHGALQQLSRKDSVKRFLEGTGCIAGVSAAASKQKMSLYEAMKGGLVSPGNALMLLEAQAATGFIIDPVKKETFPVDQAVSERLVGKEFHQQLLLAEKAVTGYTDPFTGNKLSLYQAMKKNMVERGLALRLLEAQIATGGIFDPLYGHRIPVEVAYKRGHLDEDTFLLLSDAEYAAKGFVDPNTQERITYAQLMSRCVKDAETGMYLLQLLDKGQYFYVDKVTKNILSSTKVNITLGKYKGQSVSLWELLSSDYINEEKRKELIKKYKTESSAVLQHITNEILNIIKEKEGNRRDIWFQGLRKQVTASELLKADIIGADTMKNLEEGRQTAQDVAQMDLVKQYLEGTGCIAGVLVPSRSDPSKMEKMTIYQAMWKGILRPGTALVLLEAQAATGFITDPLKNRKLSVEEAVSAGLVGAEILHKLLSAEKAVTGYADPNTGKKISLFQAMKKELILKEHGIRLLEAQIATGGIIDPVNSHRVPVEVAYRRGYFDEEMSQTLSDSTDDTKGFFDPNTHENLTYMQLLERCIPDPDTGLRMLQVQHDGFSAFDLDENVKKTLKSTTTRVSAGNFQGKETSLWDLLFSRYITDNKREEILRQFRAGKLTTQEIITILLNIIKEREDTEQMLKTTKLPIHLGKANREQSTIWEILLTGNISEVRREELLNQFQNGSLTLEELTNILIEATTRERKHHMKPDVSSDMMMMNSLREAVSRGWWGQSFGRSFSPQRGRDGYRDLLHRSKIPFFQAMKKGFVRTWASACWRPKGHGGQHDQPQPRLPVEVHTKRGYFDEEMKRVLSTHRRHKASFAPTSRKLPNGSSCCIHPSRRVRSYYANTKWHRNFEDLTNPHTTVLRDREKRAKPPGPRKLQGHQRTAPKDDDLGIRIPVPGKVAEEGSSPASGWTHAQDGGAQFATGRYLKNALRHQDCEEITKNGLVVKRCPEGNECIAGVRFPIQYIPEEKREKLLSQYRNSSLTPEEITDILGALLAEPRTRERKDPTTPETTKDTDGEEGCDAPDKVEREEDSKDTVELGEKEKSLKSQMVNVATGEFHRQRVSIWEVLHSKYVPQEKRKELLQLYKSGILTTDQMETIVTSIVNRTEEKNSSELACFSSQQEETRSSEEIQNICSPESISLEDAFRSESFVVPAGEFQGQMVSCWDLLSSKYVSEEKKQELLRQFRMEALSIQDLVGILTSIIIETERPKTKETGSPREAGLGEECGMEAHGDLQAQQKERQQELKKSLRTTLVPVSVGEYKGRRVCVLDLLFSKYVPQDKRQELLELYRAGTLPIEEMIATITAMIEEAESKRGKRSTRKKMSCMKGKLCWKDHGAHPSSIILELWVPKLDAGRLWTLQEAFCLHHPMPQEKRLAPRGPMDAGTPIMQVREEPRWPLPAPASPGEEQVIAGVLKDPGRERLSIRQATHRGLLTHGTGLALLEHQAASGYIVDVAKNRLLSVRDATNAGLVDRELFNTLLVAEKAVTGYTDPYTGSKLSLFQAMRKGLLIQEHAFRLLEAQVATGGLIHPLHSHRLPPEVAYQWGYLDGETFRLLSDPKAHAKRCFDPNARENLSYQQLLPRCLPDPETGLLMLPVADKGTIHLDEGRRQCLKEAVAQVPARVFCSQEVSVWDLIFSRYVPRHKRQELLRQYKSGSVTLPDLTQALDAMVAEAEAKAGEEGNPVPEVESSKPMPRRKGTEKALKSRVTTISAGGFHGQKVTVWDLLHCKYIPKGKRKELLKLYKSGILTTDQMESVVTAIVAKAEEEAEAAKMAAAESMANTTWEGKVSELPGEAQLRQSLKLIQIPLAFGEFQGQSVPALDVLYSKYFPREKREELMELYRTGRLTPGQMATAISGTLEKAEAGKRKFLVRAKSHGQESVRPKEAEAAEGPPAGHPTDALLKAKTITLPAGEHQGQQLSVWDLLFSPYLTRMKGEELLRKHREGKFSAQELASMLTILASLHDLFHFLEQTPTKPSASTSASASSSSSASTSAGDPTAHEVPGPLTTSSWEEEEEEEEEDDDEEDDKKDGILKARMVSVPVGEFCGQKVSVWDLLHSKYFPEKKRKEVLKLYRIGILTADQTETVATTVVTNLAGEKTREGQGGNLHASPAIGRAEGRVGASLETTTSSSCSSVRPGAKFLGQGVSMWELLFSAEVSEAKRQDLLARYITGALSAPEAASILATLIAEAHKPRSCPSLPHLFSPWTPEVLPSLAFGPRGASVHDLFLAPEREAQNAGRVTVSEITVTTTVVQGPEQKVG